MPGHHRCAEYVDAYLAESGIHDDRKSPLFRALDRRRELTDRRITRGDVLRMVKRRAAGAGLSTEISCHSFRATGITAYLEAGGTLENAQTIAAHESPRTTRLYDRTSDAISLDEIERIQIWLALGANAIRADNLTRRTSSNQEQRVHFGRSNAHAPAQ